MISIYDYSDYRMFLKDYFDEMKQELPFFSLRYFSLKAGVNSSSFYSHIIGGRRNLTKNTLVKTAKALELSIPEVNYFENLCFFNQAKTAEAKNHFFTQLTRIRSSSHSKMENKQYEYFSTWYHCVIRELICYLDCGKDYEKIASYLNPKVPVSNVQKSVELLMNLGFLSVKDGVFSQTEPNVISDNDAEFKKHRIKEFQFEMLRLAKESISEEPSYRQISSSSTYTINAQNFQEFVALIREMKKQMTLISESVKSPEDVYSLTINLFPLTNSFTPIGNEELT